MRVMTGNESDILDRVQLTRTVLAPMGLVRNFVAGLGYTGLD